MEDRILHLRQHHRLTPHGVQVNMRSSTTRSATDPSRRSGSKWHTATTDDSGFRADGSWSTYVCVRCGDERLVGPGEVHPQTV
jgi:hypothetical protein